MQEITSEVQLQEVLRELLDELAYDEDMGYPELRDNRTESFAEAGVMTANKALVVTLPTGATYQLTVVQSA